MLGKYDTPEERGDISHFKAVATALSATIGTGNIAGVATTIDLQGAIDKAKSGGTVVVPAGTYTQPITIKKGITLKGEDAILKVESNQPAVLIDSYKEVTLEGLSIIDTAKLEVEGNIIVDNEKGLVGFSAEKGKDPSISIRGKNLVHGNKTDAEKIKLPSKTVQDNPKFTDPDSGLFKTSTKGMGLEDPKVLQALWNKWQAALDQR